MSSPGLDPLYKKFLSGLLGWALTPGLVLGMHTLSHGPWGSNKPLA